MYDKISVCVCVCVCVCACNIATYSSGRRNKGEITRAVICVIKIDNRLHTSSHSSETFAAGLEGRLLLSSQKFVVGPGLLRCLLYSDPVNSVRSRRQLSKQIQKNKSKFYSPNTFGI